jgi:crotonobetainyl-CoA:carnitine CoA-transferase CaiB-like acyl-CoA transferase
MSAFSGVRVLDFSSNFAPAMAAMHLGDFGAEVIKIDPTLEERGRDAPGWLAFNRNKVRIALDLAKPADLAAAKALIAGADVAIFDPPPGELEKLGLDGATLSKAHPRLIHLWAPPYGETGKWSGLPASHTLLTALTGIAFRQASYADQPVHLTTPQAYYGQANMGAAAIGAALLERERSGLGQAIVVSGLNGAAEVSPVAKIDANPPIVFVGKPLGGSPSYRLYQCADGEWFFLGALFEAFYMKALIASDVMGEVLADPAIDGDMDKMLHPPTNQITMRKLEEAFRSKPRAEWLEILQAADVPCGPVLSRDDWFASETVAANELRVEFDHPDLGRVAIPGVSLKLEKTPGGVRHLVKNAAIGDIPARAQPAAKAQGARAMPLAGVKVLDLGAVIAGPYCGAILAGFGADVVKIEPLEGDSFRSSTAVWGSYNRGKRGLVLDLKTQAGRDVFLEMAAQADIVLDNYRLGVRERLGIDYQKLKALNPNLISLSISGYGTRGPLANLPGFDPLLQAQGGLQHAQGQEGGEPVFYQIPVNDVTTAALTAFGLIAALHARAKSGEGQEVLTSLAGTSVMAQLGEFVRYPGGPLPVKGSADCIGASALERFYQCTDEWIAIACKTKSHAAALGKTLGVKIGAEALKEARDGALADRIGAAFKSMAREEALVRLTDAGVPAAPVLRTAETFEDPFLAENNYLEVYPHSALGAVKGVARFARFEGTPATYPRSAPKLGEHSIDVLRSYGFSQDRIDALIETGAVVQT